MTQLVQTLPAGTDDGGEGDVGATEGWVWKIYWNFKLNCSHFWVKYVDQGIEQLSIIVLPFCVDMISAAWNALS